VCQARAQGDAAQDPNAVTLIVRKALSGVARVHERFGLGMVVRLVCGQPDPRLTRAGLTCVPTFGNLREHPEEWLLRVLRRCVTAGWIGFSGGDRPVVLLTEEGRAVMKGTRPARILLPPLGRPGPGPAGERHDVRNPRRPAPAAEGDEDGLDAAGQSLFDALRRHRLGLARAARVAPFVIASDRTLRDIARLRPRTLADLALAHGIGPYRVSRYGEELLRVVREAGGSS
jgi:ATP-dependent DNA helicase RecQ